MKGKKEQRHEQILGFMSVIVLGTGTKSNLGLHKPWCKAEGDAGINGSFPTNKQIIPTK